LIILLREARSKAGQEINSETIVGPPWEVRIYSKGRETGLMVIGRI
jgi:hypothetical protein